MFVATFAAGAADARIFRRRNFSPVLEKAPVAGATSDGTTARNENTYRSFSYQPTFAVAAPVSGYTVTRPAASIGFHDAGWKIRGY